MKNPLTPGGIEPGTFRFLAQHLNHCATAVSFTFRYIPTILNLSPNRVLQNANLSTNPYRIFNCAALARDLHSIVVRPYFLNLSNVLPFVKHVGCFRDTDPYYTGYYDNCSTLHFYIYLVHFFSFKSLVWIRKTN